MTEISRSLEYVMFRMFRIFRRLGLTRMIKVGSSTRIFADYFKGFENVEAVRGIFGEKTEEILSHLKIEFTWFGGYMFVDNTDGHLVINSRYLNNGDKVDIYLDLIHELCHVRQFMEGKELFDARYEYIKRPTEIEAYRYAVKEARRMGLNDQRICQYLKTEWMSDSDLKQLAKSLGVKC